MANSLQPTHQGAGIIESSLSFYTNAVVFGQRVIMGKVAVLGNEIIMGKAVVLGSQVEGVSKVGK